MKTFRTLLVASTALATLLLSPGVAGAAGSGGTAGGSATRASTCTSGDIASGTYHGLTVKGTCSIPNGATVTIRGDLNLAAGATLNAVTASTVHIDGNVDVWKGAKLGLGCSVALTMPSPGGPAICPAGVSHDVVNGNITAHQALTMLLDGLTVNGDIVSHGGGMAVTGPTASTCEEHPNPLNFPVKDNLIRGNVTITGWQGCWFGYIRNVQRGNAVLRGNHTAESDSTEVVTNTIHGNLACYANVPAAQVGDSMGSPNTVSGSKLGQCKSL